MEILFYYTESVVNPLRVRRVLAEMRGMGADAVLISVYEQDLVRWEKDLRRFFEIAAEVGLRRYVSFGRHGGVFSGHLMVPSLFSYVHPETLIVREKNSRATGSETGAGFSRFFETLCCVNHPAFRNYMKEQLREILLRYHPDGLLLDEPKGVNLSCACKHCRKARKKGESPQEANLRLQTRFLRDLCDQAKSHHRDFRTMLVVGHQDEFFLERCAKVASLDVLGAEAYWISRGKDLNWLREWCPATVKKLSAFGKKTQLWANNWGMPGSEQNHLVEAYCIMADAHPDQLASFWWWRNSDDPVRVMKLTQQGIRAARGKRIP